MYNYSQLGGIECASIVELPFSFQFFCAAKYMEFVQTITAISCDIGCQYMIVYAHSKSNNSTFTLF